MEDLMQLDRERVERFAREYEAVFYEGDYRRMASFYTEDAILIAGGMQTIEGRSAIEDFWRIVCEQGKSASSRRTIDIEHVERAGDLGYLRSTVLLERPATPKVAVRGVTIWRRQADGAWRITVDISCAAPSAELSAV